jgi:hypothetical protein
LADVLTRIEQVRAYMYQMSMTMTTSGSLSPRQPRTQDVESTILIAPEYGTKMTMNMSIDPNQNQRMIQEQYLQPQHKRMLTIMPDQNKYVEMTLTDQILEQFKKQSNDPRIMIDTMLKCDYQKIGKSRINGIEVEGFQTTDPAYMGGALGADVDVTLWVDSQTWLPVQVDMDMTIAMEDDVTMHMKGVLTNFQWDVPVDTSIFEPVIPEHYTTLASGPIKMPDMNEETAINGLKVFLKYTGQYPEEMNMTAVMSEMRKIMDDNTPVAQDLKQSMQDLDKDAKGQALNNVMMPIMATVGFHAQLVQQKRDPAYYGYIVTPETPDLILMRWKVSENEYRVIFGDLTIETVTGEQLAELESVLPQ